MIEGQIYGAIVDTNLLFSFNDLSENTKKIPLIKKLFEAGKIIVIIEQTFYLEHYSNASSMHEEANDFILRGKDKDLSMIYLPHIDIERQAIHVVGYRYA